MPHRRVRAGEINRHRDMPVRDPGMVQVMDYPQLTLRTTKLQDSLTITTVPGRVVAWSLPHDRWKRCEG